MTRDPLAAFDAGVVEAVAAEFDLDGGELRALVRRHQEGMRELPGVENLVYEWRRTARGEVLVERRADAYLLALQRPVWAEFGDALSLSGTERAALRAVHARQLEADTGVDPGGADAVVVTRP